MYGRDDATRLLSPRDLVMPQNLPRQISIEELLKEKKSSGNDEPIYLSLLFGGVGDVRHPMVTLLNLHQQTKNLSVDEKK
jgi:hypothetical protein